MESIGDEFERLVKILVRRSAEREVKKQVRAEVDDSIRQSANLFVAGPEGRAVIGKAVEAACQKDEMRDAIDWALRDKVIDMVRQTLEQYVVSPEFDHFLTAILREQVAALLQQPPFTQQIENYTKESIGRLLQQAFGVSQNGMR